MPSASTAERGDLLRQRPAGRSAGGTAEIDARPSDALNLALVSGASIQADRRMVDAVLATEPGARDTLRLWEGQDVSGARALIDELLRPPEQPDQ